MERYCPSCHAVIEKNSTKCSGCGSRLEEKKEVNRRLFIVPIVVVILVAVSLFTVMLIDLTKTPEETIQGAIVIDGEFEDWEDVTTYSDDDYIPPFNTNIDIIYYRVDDRETELSFYLEVSGRMFAGEIGGEQYVDTAYIFIDTDLSPLTGYFINGIGADYMIEVYGIGGEVIASNYYRYTAMIQDWNMWIETGSVEAVSSGSELETQIPFNMLFLGEGDNVDVLFYMQSWERFEDFSDTIISNVEGVLSVIQQGVAEDIVTGNNNRILRMDLEAINARITITSIIVERTGIGSDGDVSSLRLEDSHGITISTGTLSNSIATFGSIDIMLSEGQSRRLYIVIDISANAIAGNSIGFKIMNNHNIQTDTGTISLESISPESGQNDNAYMGSVPDDVRIDGAFADWNDDDLKNDNTSEEWRNNLEITQYGISSDSRAVKFYLRVEGEICGGTELPFWNSITVTNPIVEDDSPKTGEDVVYIFLDTVNETGFNVTPGVGADYLIEVRGWHNQILSHVYYQFAGNDNNDWNWIELGTVSVACDSTQMEISIGWEGIGVNPNTDQFFVFFTVMDWTEENFDTSDSYLVGPTR